jgi:hypothetical protein
MINNFKNNVRGLEYRDPETKRVLGATVGWDYGHEADKKSAGWIKDLEKRDKTLPTGRKVKSLWAQNYTWTPAAQEAIKAGEWLFPSVDYNDFQNTVTGKTYKDVLFGVALTNRPAVKYLEPIQLRETDSTPSGRDDKKNLKGEIKMFGKLKELLQKNGVSLAEGVSDDTVEYAACEKIKGLSEVLSMSEKKLAETESDLKKAQAEVAAAKKKAEEEEAEKKAEKEKAEKEKKSKLMEAAKKVYTPAVFAKGETSFHEALKSDNIALAEKILAEKGVAFKETRSDEGEADAEEDAGPDTTKDWDSQDNDVKDKVITAHMKSQKMDTEDPKSYNKAEVAVAKEHNQKYASRIAAAKKEGGKK